ncbi:hypothetical protein [Flavobacterium taihuense]|uniref:Uncharacterized protein n=1 Tax=Flavobacterium taihuense TaxID=2857508 RepID=A0ABS6XRU2_9FLAO|nr:hypothetical protein [Flavobacterium taihuense]MBW4359390.1 hypothetical protein [Flavobacterium taihuense]
MGNIIEFYKTSLGIDLNNLKHPISMMVSLAMSTHEFDQQILRHKLRVLGLALMDIKEHSEELYTFYLKKIVKNADLSVNGFIFETIQCANLISTAVEYNMEFKFGDHNKKEPDFFLNNCGFELTTVRFSPESNKLNGDKRLLSSFRDKNKKKYANENTALLIEVTQIAHYANQPEFRPKLSFNDVLEIFKTDSKFGVVLSYVEFTVPTENNIEFKGTVYPVYRENCNAELLETIQKITKGQINNFSKYPLLSPY